MKDFEKYILLFKFIYIILLLLIIKKNFKNLLNIDYINIYKLKYNYRVVNFQIENFEKHMIFSHKNIFSNNKKCYK